MKYTIITFVLLSSLSTINPMEKSSDKSETDSGPISITKLNRQHSSNSSGDCKMPTVHSSDSGTSFENQTTDEPKKKTGTLKRRTKNKKGKQSVVFEEESEREHTSYRLDQLGKDARKKSFHPGLAGKVLRENSDLEDRRETLKDELSQAFPNLPIYTKFVDFIADETNTLHDDVKEITEQRLKELEERLNTQFTSQQNNQNHWGQKIFWSSLGAGTTLAIVSASNLITTALVCGK